MSLRKRKKIITRRPKTKEIEIVSRRDQPEVTYPVQVLKRQDIPERPVSSSWIASLAYDKDSKTATMGLISGRSYDIRMPMGVFADWYYAHSKGTYWNKNVRGKYGVRRAL